MLYVVRHGQTDWNVANRVQGLTDILLNETGIAQANELKENLKDIKFSKVFTSPLMRAKETAEIISGSENLVSIDKRLIERGMGNYEGKEPHNFDRDLIWDYSKNSGIDNIVKTLLDRVYNFLDEYKDLYSKEDVLVVTHGGIYPAIEAYFNGIPEDNQMLKRRIKNCEVIKYASNKEA